MEKQVYMVSDIVDILGISKSKAYDFVRDAYKKRGFFSCDQDCRNLSYP